MSLIRIAREGYVPSLILWCATYSMTAGRGLPRMLYPAAFSSTILDAAAEFAENCTIWLSGIARFKGIGCGDRADKDQHDQPHPFLSVVGAVRKTDAGASEDQQSPDPPCRGLVRLRRPVEFGLPNECLYREQQEGRGDKSHQRGEQQRFADIGRLPPIDTRGAVLPAGERVGDADADDRADQCMRARCRETQIPGSEVPNDRGAQQREDHRKPGEAADLQDQFHWQ